jgi:site-specific recombinase XerC
MVNEQTTIKHLRQRLQDSKGISEHNRTKVLEFINRKQQQHEKPSTIKGYLQVLLYLSKWAGSRKLENICKEEKEMIAYFAQLKPIKYIHVKSSKGDIIEERPRKKPFEKSTLFLYQVRLKTFIKWLFKLKKHDEVPSMTWVKKHNGKELTKDDILQPVEIQLMVDSTDNLRDKAMVLSLFESMCRASEFLQWNVGSLKIEGDYAKVEVNGKGDRKYTAYVVNSLPAIREWRESHPFKNNPEAPLWISFDRRRYGMSLTITALNEILKRIARRAGVEKRIYPHIMRHSGITQKVKENFNTELLKRMVGHSKNSNMIANTYSHLAGEDVEEELKRKYGLDGAEEVAPQLNRIVCPRCGKVWSPGQKYCSCNYIFDITEIEKKEQNTKEQIKVMIEAALDARKS